MLHQIDRAIITHVGNPLAKLGDFLFGISRWELAAQCMYMMLVFRVIGFILNSQILMTQLGRFSPIAILGALDVLILSYVALINIRRWKQALTAEDRGRIVQEASAPMIIFQRAIWGIFHLGAGLIMAGASMGGSPDEMLASLVLRSGDIALSLAYYIAAADKPPAQRRRQFDMLPDAA